MKFLRAKGVANLRGRLKSRGPFWALGEAGDLRLLTHENPFFNVFHHSTSPHQLNDRHKYPRARVPSERYTDDDDDDDDDVLTLTHSPEILPLVTEHPTLTQGNIYSNQNLIYCAHRGGYMVFGSIEASEYYSKVPLNSVELPGV